MTAQQNKEYWAGRSAQRIIDSEKLCLEFEKRMIAAFHSALEGINGEISKLYAKYAKDNKMDYADALKYLTNNELKEFKRDVWWYIEKARDKDYRIDNKQYLQALSTRARVKRLEMLGANILMESEKLYNELESSSKQMLNKVYEKTYYKTAFDTFQQIGYGIEFSKFAKQAAHKLLEYPWDGKNYSDNIWDKQKDFVGEMNKVITRGMIQGQSVQEMSRALRNANLGKDYDKGKKGGQLYNATRVVRTETNFIANQATKDMYSDLGMKQYEYCATLDSKTSEVCQGLDGHVFDTNDAKPGVNYPPMHPHCRSTTVPYFEDLGGTRLAKNADGKYYEVPANMKYKDWYNSLSENEKGKMAINAKIAKNAAADKEQHKEYKFILGKDAPKTFAEFQDLKYNKPKEWDDIKGLVRYLSDYPESDSKYYRINKELKGSGIDFGTAVNPLINIRAFILPDTSVKKDQYHIMKRMSERHISDDDVRSYKENAKIAFSQANGTRYMFLNEDGVSVIKHVGEDWLYKTTYSKYDFDESIEKVLEVLNKHVK